MTSRSESYRCVCALCQTVLVSARPDGTFESFGAAAAVARAHLFHRCEKVTKRPRPNELDIVADASVKVIEKGEAA